MWVEAGGQSKSNLRYINMNKIYNQLEETVGETLCKALPVYLALRSCDYSAFTFLVRFLLIHLKTVTHFSIKSFPFLHFR